MVSRTTCQDHKLEDAKDNVAALRNHAMDETPVCCLLAPLSLSLSYRPRYREL